MEFVGSQLFIIVVMIVVPLIAMLFGSKLDDKTKEGCFSVIGIVSLIIALIAGIINVLNAD